MVMWFACLAPLGLRKFNSSRVRPRTTFIPTLPCLRVLGVQY
jgi:hypothetical protein